MGMETNPPERKYIILHPRDNTATALTDLGRGEAIQLPGGEIQLRQDIPYAHKFALAHVPEGEDVVKYGEVIGAATADIRPGEHVHVHNVKSKRARGDAP